MDDPLNNIPEIERGDSDEKGKSSAVKRRNFFGSWMEFFLQLGLGESFLRLLTNFLLILAVAGVVFFMRGFYSDEPLGEAASSAAPQPTQEVVLDDADAAEIYEMRGVLREAMPHTIIPTRPRQEILLYEVQDGDTVFGIAERFGLTPQTVLWGNYNVLLDDPHRLKAGQELTILPVNGTYYEWQDGDGLNGVAEFFGVEPEVIVAYPANRLNADLIGDYARPGIAPGTWLIVPGGERQFISWSAPVGVTRDNPAVASILGEGACGSIEGGAVGYGSFVWPSANHYLSGYDWSPETNHRGIDIAGHLGMAIFAADAGVVVYAGWNDYGYGNMVIVDHGTGFQTLYAHMSALNVVCGQSVGQGEVIGAFGTTGASSGVHLHFELMHSQYSKVNPWDYLPPP